MYNEKKKDNVVGIGHNQENNFSKEQYQKLMRGTHAALCFAKAMVSDIEHKFDEAFTKHENARSWNRRLKDFEVHEKRIKAKDMSDKAWKYLDDQVKALEEKAKVKGIEIEGSND